ncbi:MAG: 16S rRNA (cytosine(967)-C(5))-methyltransferase [Gammaproteobacteria bacterium RBG_16_57_12]|nr:MAG: 16S rRNA (cytosine(967)-C(5))-methyltransferase [Gammaproteobacteria bacterium RBG_16_57_12]
MNPRSLAARVLVQVLEEGRSLPAVLNAASREINTSETSLLRELCYGTLRWQRRLDGVLRPLLNKPLRRKDGDIHALLLIGLYQLMYLRIAPHAAVAETVAAAVALNKEWAKGLVNAVLRNYLRQAGELEARADRQEEARYAHPAWLIEQLKQSWPACWQAILDANNERPPMTLRINRCRTTRDDYLVKLAQAGMAASVLPHVAEAIALERPVPVETLPGFAAGLVSVQDGAAQLAAHLMDLRPGQRVLDACAAPGGKTCHMRELEPALATLIALDSDAVRLSLIEENLKRLQLAATVVSGDAGTPAPWWDGMGFDRILLDAPCSATGVIRRHPDIKALRHAEDIAALAQTQHNLLEALWPLLVPGGRLVYATCSVLPRENEEQVQAFLARHDDAREIAPAGDWGEPRPAGRQIFPGYGGMDGFYYACVEKIDAGRK